MKQLFFIIIIMNFGLSSFGKELPNWVERDAKLKTFEQLLEWMRDDKFYMMTKMTSEEVVIGSGQLSQKTEIFFNDVAGCKNRKIISTCTPFDLDTDQPFLVCQILGTDCDGQNILKVQIKN